MLSIRNSIQFAKRRIKNSLEQNIYSKHYPHIPICNSYWWDFRKNFGDLITPCLLMQYGMLPRLVNPAEADVTSTGSILQFLPNNYSGIILGTGLKDRPSKPIPFPNAIVAGVRGYLTLESIQCEGNPHIGDPGLLACDFPYEPQEKDYELGVIVHFFQKDAVEIKQFQEKYKDHILMIDVLRSPREVFQDIAKCKAIASSSLHGIIVSDSLGVPSVLITPPHQEPIFKYEDYYSSVQRAFKKISFTGSNKLSEVVNDAESASTIVINEIQSNLRRSFLSIPEKINQFRSTPK